MLERGSLQLIINCQAIMIINFCIAKTTRIAFLNLQHTKAGPPHAISRNEIFDGVIKLYQMKQSTLEAEFPFSISFIGERAVDTGGVSRDVFSIFQ